MKHLIATTAVMTVADARIQWGFCPDVPKVMNFDYTRFGGTWYEIFRDKDHYAIDNQ